MMFGTLSLSSPTKFNVFVLEMELDIHFDVNGIILEDDVPIGLVTIVANTNDYGR